jgi:hypothetical protein
LETDLNLNGIAHDYPLSGGPIMNAIRVASLRALTEKGRRIGRDDVRRRDPARTGKGREGRMKSIAARGPEATAFEAPRHGTIA